MNRFFLLVSLVLWSTAAAWAQSATRAPLFAPGSISQKTLPNGVRSVVHEAPGTDLVSLQVWVRAGSRFETAQNNGVTHLLETIALESSKNFPAAGGGPRKALANLGGNAGGLTARDSMFLSATVASPFLPEAMRILADGVLSPDLSDARVASAKAGVLSELVLNTGDPLLGAADLAYATSFNRHPYRLAAQGSRDGLSTLSAAAVRAYHTARFTGGNISVIIAGDVAATTGHALVARHFDTAPKAGATPAISQDKAPTEVLRASRPGLLPVSTLAMAWRSPPITAPNDVIAMDILLAHWKEGRQPRLKAVLNAPPLGGNRDEEALEDDEAESTPRDGNEAAQPLAAGFDVEYLTQRDSGLFLVTLLAPRERGAVTGAVLEEVARLRESGLSPAELSRARFFLTQQYLAQSESVSGLAGALGFYEMIADYNFAVEYLDRIARITNDDIKRMANTYLIPTAYVQATIEGRTPPSAPDSGGTITARVFRQGEEKTGRQGEGL